MRTLKKPNKVHCAYCKKPIDLNNCYLRKNGSPHNICKPCTVLDSYEKRWLKKSNDEVLAEIRRVEVRLRILKWMVSDVGD